jgi:hypothetical protein
MSIVLNGKSVVLQSKLDSTVAYSSFGKSNCRCQLNKNCLKEHYETTDISWNIVEIIHL